MKTMNQTKSTVEEIRTKFDQLAEKYSDLSVGQETALDSPLCLDLVAQSAKIFNPDAKKVADLGTGGGNYIVKLTSFLPNVDVTLVDLSANMLKVASKRVDYNISGSVQTIQADFRDIQLEKNAYDIIIAATSLHHLRTNEEWQSVFTMIYNALKPGGSFWINDVIIEDNQALNELMHQKWLKILEEKIGKEQTLKCMKQYEVEDTPQSLNFQLNLMKHVGFRETHILHKHFCFATFGAIK